MPIITRYFIRTGFVCLALALLSALLLAVRPLIAMPEAIGALTPVYFHLFMVGWVTQLIFGVAYWMFPIFKKEQPRGSIPLAWATYILLNLGLLLRVIGEPMITTSSNPLWGGSLALSALMQWVAGLCFVINTWPRVKER